MSRSTVRVVPPSNLPIVDANGLCERTWYKFFLDINEDLGGDGKNDVGGLIDGTTSIAGQLSAGALPSQLVKAGFAPITSNPVTITAVGGMGAPYTYATSQVSGDAFVILNGATSTPSFRVDVLAPTQTKTGMYKTTVGDGSTTFDVLYQVTFTDAT